MNFSPSILWEGFIFGGELGIKGEGVAGNLRVEVANGFSALCKLAKYLTALLGCYAVEGNALDGG